MNDSDRTQAVLELIRTSCQGHRNAMTARSLSRITGVTEREVRDIVANLRRKGHLIASAVNPPYGFYIPENMGEAKACQRHLRSRITQLKATAKAFDAAINTTVNKHIQQHQLPL